MEPPWFFSATICTGTLVAQVVPSRGGVGDGAGPAFGAAGGDRVVGEDVGDAVGVLAQAMMPQVPSPLGGSTAMTRRVKFGSRGDAETRSAVRTPMFPFCTIFAAWSKSFRRCGS